MADLLSAASGNLTAVASVWAAMATGTGAKALNRFGNSTNTSTVYQYSPTFTVTNGEVLDGVLVFLFRATGSPTGTFSVALSDDNGVTATREVTINATDIPASALSVTAATPVLLKFGSTLTGDGGSDYRIGVKSSVNAQIGVARASATASDWMHAIRTTSLVTAAAGDNLYVVGENTGAGTGNDLTVTMNSTATTDYGTVDIGNRGFWGFGTAAATDYIFRQSGNFNGWAGGGWVNGSGAEVPTGSTARHQFDCTTDGEFGLLFNDGFNPDCRGQERTVGKPVVQCKLTADTPVNALSGLGAAATNVTAAPTTLRMDPSQNYFGFGNEIVQQLTDTVANGIHLYGITGSAITNTTQVFSVFIARGTGTNNRYCRIQVNSTGNTYAGNGFYADCDLQAGTIGTCTAYGTGTATSATITPYAGGFVVTLVGKCASGSATPVGSVGIQNTAGNTSAFVGANNIAFFVWGWSLITASAFTGDISVDTDTGWLAGDTICIGTTTQTANQCEPVLQAANAGASTLSGIQLPFYAHNGTSPVQAVVALLNRNVVFESTSPTIMSYVYCAPLATVTFRWVEFRWLGESVANKRGIEIATTTGSFDMRYCSVHDCEDNGIYMLGTSLNNVSIQDTLQWNCATATGPSLNITNQTSGTAIVLNNYINMRCGSNVAVSLGDLGGTFTNITVIGNPSNYGLALADTSPIGTMSDILLCGNAGGGVTVQSGGVNGVITNLTAWRNQGPGFNSSAGFIGTLNNPVLFGNNTTNLTLTAGSDVTINGGAFNGDTTFATSYGISFGTNGGVYLLKLNDCTLGVASGILTTHSIGDVRCAGAPISPQAYFYNCILGSATEVVTQSNMSENGFISSQKHDQTAGLWRTWTKNGTTQPDSVIVNVATPSQRCITNPASTGKAETSPKSVLGRQVAVDSGGTATVTVYVRKSVVGDGVAYNGAQPRLICRANPALGLAVDTVIDTMSVAGGTWEQLSGVTPTANDDGVFQCVVDYDGTAGWINVNEWAA